MRTVFRPGNGVIVSYALMTGAHTVGVGRLSGNWSVRFGSGQSQPDFTILNFTVFETLQGVSYNITAYYPLTLQSVPVRFNDLKRTFI